MNREELDKINRDIEKARTMKIDAMKRGMRHTGWRRRVFLRFSRFFDWAIRFGEKIRDQEMRGD